MTNLQTTCFTDEELALHALEDDSWIDGLLTSGFHPIDDEELFGEPISGYSLY